MLADSGYDAASRQEILRSGIRKHYRDLAKATKEGSSIYRTRVQMNKEKELKTLLDKPWFRRMRGGTKLRMMKEGTERMEARLKVGRSRKDQKDQKACEKERDFH